MNYLITNLLLAILLVLILSIISVVLATLTAAVWLSKQSCQSVHQEQEE